MRIVLPPPRWLQIFVCSFIASLAFQHCSRKPNPEPLIIGGSTQSEAGRQAEMVNSFCPESSERILTQADLAKFSPYQLKIVKNEIYARHGYVFKTQDMIEYFSRQSWYKPDPTFDISEISAIEQQNVTAIKHLEEKAESVTNAPPANSKEATDAWARRVAMDEGGELLSKKTFTIDFDDDGDLDVVGLCAVGGGGSGYHQVISVFENKQGVLSFQASGDAGGSGDWTINKVMSAGHRRLVCMADAWLKDDPNCCPTGKKFVKYQIQGEMLVAE